MADQADDSVVVALELKAENDRLRQRLELKDERIESQREVIATYRDALAALQAEQQLRGALHLTDLAALSQTKGPTPSSTTATPSSMIG